MLMMVINMICCSLCYIPSSETMLGQILKKETWYSVVLTFLPREQMLATPDRHTLLSSMWLNAKKLPETILLSGENVNVPMFLQQHSLEQVCSHITYSL